MFKRSLSTKKLFERKPRPNSNTEPNAGNILDEGKPRPNVGENHLDAGKPPLHPGGDHPNAGKPPINLAGDHPNAGKPPINLAEDHPNAGKPPINLAEDHPNAGKPPINLAEDHPNAGKPIEKKRIEKGLEEVDEKNREQKPVMKKTISMSSSSSDKDIDEDVASASELERSGRRKSKMIPGVNGSTPIMVACKEGKYALVEKLLERGASLSDIDMDGMTALHYASLSGSESTVKVLVKQKSDLTLSTNKQGQTALHLACTRIAGAVSVVKFLVRSMGDEAKLMKDKDGNTPLLLAVETGNQLVVRELLTNKAKEQLKIVRSDSGDSAFHYCARKKDVEMARILLDAGSAINLKNNEGQTAFHIAAYEGDESMIKLLSTSNKLSADIQDKHDRTAVHIAAERGFSDIVEYLVDKVKVDVNFRAKSGDTLVHIAAQNGHSETVLTLLKKGVPLHMPNKSGEVSLHAAVHCGHVGVVKALLNKGASVDTKTKDMYTPLHIAVQHRQPRVVQTLLGYGANVHLKGGRLEETPLHIAARIKGGTGVADMLLKSGANVDVPQENGETSLHIATRNGNLAMVKLLLVEGANASRKSRTGEIPLHIAIEKSLEDIVLVLVNHTLASCLMVTHGVKLIVNSPNKKGETPLHYVCKLRNDNEIGERDLRTAKLLLKYGANPNLETAEVKETAVHYCARHGNNEILLALFNAVSADEVQRLVNQKTRDGLTPLLISSKEGNLDVIKSLMSRQARLDAFDQKGKTPLHLSCEHGHKDVVQFLLNSKAYINAKTKLGLTALHLAAQKGFKDIVEMLVTSFSASIDALSLEGKTPLHLAAEGGKLEVCKILLHLKADTSATDNKGRTPLHYAAQKDHSDVIEFFLENRPQLVNQANAEGETCAHIAAAKGSVAVIKELLKLKDIHMTEKFTTGSNSTPLHLAASGGHTEVVQVLLQNGADATPMDKHGMTAIHLAAKNGHTRVIEILKEKIPLDYASPKTGLSAIHVAAQYGRTEVVREILRQADIGDIRSEATKTKKDDEYGYTPLHLAARSGNDQVVRLLLNSPGVRVDTSTAQNRSLPLHLASSSGHANVVSLLLSKFAHQLDTKDAKGRTAFHLAATNGHHNVLTLLLAQGAQIDAEDEDGWIALHFSAHSGHLPVVKQLIESGSNLTKETTDGKVAVCYAAHAGHVTVVRYLLNLKFDASHLLMDKTVFSVNVTKLNLAGDRIAFAHRVLKTANISDSECEKNVADAVCKVSIPACSKDQTKVVSFLSKQDCREIMGCVNKTNDANSIQQAHGLCDHLPDGTTAKKYSLDNVYDNKAAVHAMAFSTILFIAILVAESFF
ncbi:serine threonine- phosphatase 6 regulatory ankyrin repeat subunit A-like [Paramuricea clavata]|uniref:Serine threonine- phosphatase 6 regulatory ankyrin repeat subunit A-like n=1 Tax=Paramuricea clavata TaxID=317549 RepID=A0A7D9HHW5_PARCT|nr:serine threonine- phosphatase 6 regulatory ankyrin repeat subunit A-like [Paramuricea clavata]